MIQFRQQYQLTWLKHNASTLAHYMKPEYRFSERISKVGDRYRHVADAFSKHIDLDTHTSNSILGKGFRILVPQFIELFENCHTSVVLFKAKYNRVKEQIPGPNNQENNEIPDSRLDSRVRNDLYRPRQVVHCNTIFDHPGDCPVCCMEIGQEERLSCGHYIHKSCIIFSAQTVCPMCRQEVELTREEHIKLSCVKHKIPNIYMDDDNRVMTITAVHFNVLPGEDLANDYYAHNASNVTPSMLVNNGVVNGNSIYVQNYA